MCIILRLLFIFKQKIIISFTKCNVDKMKGIQTKIKYNITY